MCSNLELQSIWLWKDIHRPRVSRSLDHDPTSKHPRDESPEDGDPQCKAPKRKKTRRGKWERSKDKARAVLIAAAGPDEPIPSIENEEKHTPSTSSVVASVDTYHGGSDFGAGVEDQEQLEIGFHAEQSINGSVGRRPTWSYDILDKIIDDDFEKKWDIVMRDMEVLEAKRALLKDLRKDVEFRTARKMDAFNEMVGKLQLEEDAE